MGYRSSVEIIVYGEPEIFDAFIASMKLANHSVFTDWVDWDRDAESPVFSYTEVNTRGLEDTSYKLMHFRVDEVKWYDGYEAIVAWENDFLPKAVDVGLNWEFARIGEDSGDAVCNAGGDDVYGLLSITSYIESDY